MVHYRALEIPEARLLSHVRSSPVQSASVLALTTDGRTVLPVLSNVCLGPLNVPTATTLYG